jgi:hypothetical protein
LICHTGSSKGDTGIVERAEGRKNAAELLDHRRRDATFMTCAEKHKDMALNRK